MAAYAVVLMLLHGILPGNIFLLPVFLFFLAGSFVAYKEYDEGLKELQKDTRERLMALENKRVSLEDEIKAEEGQVFRLRNRESMIVNLYEVTKRMSDDLTFNGIFGELSAFLRENFSFSESELIILKETDGYIRVDKVYKLHKERPDESSGQEAEPDYGATLSLFAKDKKGVYMPKEDGTSFGAIPLLSENKFVGILTVADISGADFERLSIVAMQFALELKKVLLYETVEALATTDSLTGLYTRRYFFERLNEELSRSRSRDFKLSFIMIDIDDFKKCNDTHGHLVGDVVLKEVSRIIKENVREIDLVARYGGEEFSVMLPETDKKGSMLVAERIRKKIEESTFRAYDETLKITVSAGVAVYPHDASGTEELVERSDKALYAAKSSGKNIVCEYKG
jgi:diguanylate cyclase (GGDEF)-like protein